MNPDSNCQNPEEKIVDYVLGQLTVVEETDIQEHIKQCGTCSKLYEEWSSTLGGEPVVDKAPKRIKRRIRKSIHVPGRLSASKPIFTFAFVFALMIMVLSTSTQDWFHPQKVQSKPFVQVESISTHENRAFNQLDSYVWYSPDRNEIAVYVKGLPSVGTNNYRAWLKNEHGLANAGILKVNYTQTGELYYQGRELEDTDYIIFTVEAAGQNTKPTGPEVFFIKLHQVQ